MKMDYRVARDFWRNGNLVPAGEILSLTARQAQYLSHVLEPVVDEAEPAEEIPAEPKPKLAPEPAPEPAPAAPLSAETVTFELKPARKAKKPPAAEADHGDDA